MLPAFFSFGTAGMAYAILVPVLILELFAILFIPSMLVPGSRPFAVGKAVYCYLLMTLGILLMTLGGLPALHAVIEKILTGNERYTTEIYIALLVLFATGGFTFLWHERMVESVDDASRKVTAAAFWFTFKLLGYALMVTSALAFILTMLLTGETFAHTWWIMPMLLFLYGLLLGWCTRFPQKHVPIPPHVHLAAKKAAVKKKMVLKAA